MPDMKKVNHEYERGWRRYGFDNLPFIRDEIHGSTDYIDVFTIFNRGVHKPHISFATLYPTDKPSIGMHLHRDIEEGWDTEEWYIIIDGEGEMVFSNGDVVKCKSGDLLEIYPATGHSFRAINGPCRIISITPDMFGPADNYVAVDPYPEEFNPRIKVTEVDEAVVARKAVCTVCGEEWVCPADDIGAESLPVWARGHRHGEEGIE